MIKKDFWQFVRFCCVGIINNVVMLGIYYFLLFFHTNIYGAYGCGYAVSLVSAYLLNRFWVFQKNNKSSIIKFLAVYGFSFILSYLLLWLFVDVVRISDKIAPVFILFITTCSNFILNKFWAFQNKEKKG